MATALARNYLPREVGDVAGDLCFGRICRTFIVPNGRTVLVAMSGKFSPRQQVVDAGLQQAALEDPYGLNATRGVAGRSHSARISWLPVVICGVVLAVLYRHNNTQK